MRGVVLVCLTAVAASAFAAREEPIEAGQDVDVFIGSEGLGHVWPAAAAPFGLVQAGPDTAAEATGFRHDSLHHGGYQHSDEWVCRFSQTRLSGTGCASGGDFGLLPYCHAPTNGVFAERMEKSSERASPGFYSVRLASGILCEIAALAHTAAYRFTYPEGSPRKLLVDLDSVIGSQIGDHGEFERVFAARVDSCSFDLPDSRMCLMSRKVRAWVDYEPKCAICFSLPVRSHRRIVAQQGLHGEKWELDFGPSDGVPLELRLGLSLTSTEAARANLQAEMPVFDFADAVARAAVGWQRILSRVELGETTPADVRRIFYTSLYRTCLQPNDIGDVGCEDYSTFSLWDTFRAAHPLYTILAPERVDGFVRSLLRVYRRNGYLPIWGLWGTDNHCMIGHHAVPVIVDAYLKGFRGFDAELAWKAVDDSLTRTHRAVNDGTWGMLKEDWPLIDRYGYLPFDAMTGESRGRKVIGESVSRLLECAYDDACAARFARALGKPEKAAFFARRSGNWRNVLDPETGYVRGRDRKGNWRTPFDPKRCGHCWFQDNDFTEGNAMQYTWHVMQDPEGLIAALGGCESALERLIALFEAESKAYGENNAHDVSGLVGQYAHGNEPSHHIAYFFTLLGRPDLAGQYLRRIFETQYGTAADGLNGNEDCGQMSAWYLFTALGFYPLDPCGGDYVIGAPQVSAAQVKVGGEGERRTFRVLAKGLSKENKYVRSVRLNGKPITNWKIRHEDIMKGGEIVFEMGRPD